MNACVGNDWKQKERAILVYTHEIYIDSTDWDESLHLKKAPNKEAVICWRNKPTLQIANLYTLTDLPAAPPAGLIGKLGGKIY